MSSVPLMVQCPRFVAKMTIGLRVDSSARFKYVKHSKLSMWTLNRNVSKREAGVLHLVDEQDARNQLSNALVNVLVNYLRNGYGK